MAVIGYGECVDYGWEWVRGVGGLWLGLGMRSGCFFRAALGMNSKMLGKGYDWEVGKRFRDAMGAGSR